jgi:rhodanese-related sulfurtransferase
MIGTVLFRQITHDDLGCASYLIGDEDAGVAAVVDPRFEIDEYLELARYRGVTIEHVLETHNHADHVSGHGRLVAATGARIHIHRLAAPDYDHEPFDDGWELRLGTLLTRASARSSRGSPSTTARSCSSGATTRTAAAPRAWRWRSACANVGGLLAGGMTNWRQEGNEAGRTERLPAAELPARMRADPGLQLLDVREREEWDEGHVPGSVWRAWHDIDALPEGLDPDRPVAVACAAGRRSATAASLLKLHGVRDAIHVVDGGVPTLARLGVELESEPARAV